MIKKEEENILYFIEDLAAAKLDRAFEQSIRSRKLSYLYEYEIIREVYDAVFESLSKKEDL